MSPATRTRSRGSRSMVTRTLFGHLEPLDPLHDSRRAPPSSPLNNPAAPDRADPDVHAAHVKAACTAIESLRLERSWRPRSMLDARGVAVGHPLPMLRLPFVVERDHDKLFRVALSPIDGIRAAGCRSSRTACTWCPAPAPCGYAPGRRNRRRSGPGPQSRRRCRRAGAPARLRGWRRALRRAGRGYAAPSARASPLRCPRGCRAGLAASSSETVVFSRIIVAGLALIHPRPGSGSPVMTASAYLDLGNALAPPVVHQIQRRLRTGQDDTPAPRSKRRSGTTFMPAPRSARSSRARRGSGCPGR